MALESKQLQRGCGAPTDQPGKSNLSILYAKDVLDFREEVANYYFMNCFQPLSNKLYI